MYVVLFSTDNDGALITSPETATAFLNDIARFHCASTAYSVYWEVDGIEARHSSIRNRTISFQTTNHGLISILTVEASPLNNNTQVVCAAYDFGTDQVIHRSPVVYLYIQGQYNSITVLLLSMLAILILIDL